MFGFERSCGQAQQTNATKRQFERDLRAKHRYPPCERPEVEPLSPYTSGERTGVRSAESVWCGPFRRARGSRASRTAERERQQGKGCEK